MSEEFVIIWAYSIFQMPTSVTSIRNYEFVDYDTLRHSVKYRVVPDPSYRGKYIYKTQ